MQNLMKKTEINLVNQSENEKKRTLPKVLFESVSGENKSNKKMKLKKREKVIFGLIRDDFTSKIKIPSENLKESVPSKKESRRKKKESSFNTGRWQQEEHQRFIEALLKYGNDWKSVQKHVGSRSSTQARSHAQKFFVKIGKTQIENLQLDFENNSLKSLNIMASNLNNDQMARAIKSLNEMAFDKKNSGRKSSKFTKQENSPFSKIINPFDLEKEYLENSAGEFCLGEKLNCQYSTSADVSASGALKLTKK
jgi:SHAQKYF class myb-like DNA-binding protein